MNVCLSVRHHVQLRQKEPKDWFVTIEYGCMGRRICKWGLNKMYLCVIAGTTFTPRDVKVQYIEAQVNCERGPGRICHGFGPWGRDQVENLVGFQVIFEIKKSALMRI